jgi:ligand-binding sensor domain-containing protein/signal transduction histidine kinase
MKVFNHFPWHSILESIIILMMLGSLFFDPLSTPVQARSIPKTVTLPVVAGRDIQFKALTGEEGLSSGQVFGIAQDDRGFLWFATGDGLNRYDGYSSRTYRFDRNNPNSLGNNSMTAILQGQGGILWLATTGEGVDRFDPATETFTHYRHDPDNPNSLSGNHISKYALYEDKQGVLWIGSIDNGLNRLDPATGTFIHYRHDPKDANSLSSNDIESIYQDVDGMIWIGTADAGLNRLDPISGQITRYLPNPDDPYTLPDKDVRTVYEDRAGMFWVATQKGFGSLDRSTGRFTRYAIAPNQPDAASLNSIMQFHEDSVGNLWLGTEGAGVLKFDRRQQQIVQYKNDPANPHSLRNNFISSFHEDPSGTLWVGTLGGGANMFSTRPPKFAHYKHEADNPNSVADNFILSIFEDHTGVVWVGNDRTLNRWDRRSNTWQVYRNDPQNPASISNGSVTATQEDPDGTLWFGTFFGGLNRFDPKSGHFKAYRFDLNDPHSLGDDIVRSLYRDSNGVLWVGGWNDGLSRFDRTTETFQRYLPDPDKPDSLSAGSVTDIYEDRAKTLWVATEGGGLNRFDPATETFTRFQNDPQNLESLPDDAVRVLYEDQSGQFWVGTAGGLCAFDRASETCTTVYTVKEGLPNNTIEGILEDEQGNLWISTNNGLSRFNPKTQVFRNYDVLDGLQSNEFHVFTAFYKSPRTGEMYFGGINGFNVFDPAQVTDDPFTPPVVLTDFHLFGKSVPVGGDSILKKTINETDALTLLFNQNSLSLEFSALSYVAPAKNLFRYKLEGFDADWRTVDSKERLAVYTNLDAGNYVFRVQGTNEDGVWNEQGTTLKITITPPWWETWWFRGAVLAALLALIFGGHQWRSRSIRQRNLELERLVAERTTQLEVANKELEAFAYSVSHDLRAPLRHIDGFIDMLHSRIEASLDDKSRHYMDMIADSARKMGMLIDDLLSFSRMGRSEMSKVQVDLNELVQGIIQEFGGETEGRDIQWEITPLPIVSGDRAMLRVVLVNLIANALKFTRPRLTAQIEIGCEKNDETGTTIFVRDNGVGFDMQYVDKLFGVFQRLHRQEDFEGTGIGLANIRRIISRHGGRTWAQGEVDHGATFYFSLPDLTKGSDAKET